MDHDDLLEHPGTFDCAEFERSIAGRVRVTTQTSPTGSRPERPEC